MYEELSTKKYEIVLMGDWVGFMYEGNEFKFSYNFKLN